MSGKLVENSANICDAIASEAKDKGLLLVTVRERNTLPPFLCRFSEDGKVVLGLEQTMHGGFRKIEPKPTIERKEDDCEDNDGADARIPRFLESKSTRRGVRICPTCQGRVGYRSKVCKHCLKSSGFSSKSTSNVKRRQSGQKRAKGKPKKSARVVQKESDHVQRKSEDCHTMLSIDNLKVQISDTKSGDAMLYGHDPRTTSTLEPISNLDLEFSAVANRTLPIENACQMAVNKGGNEMIEEQRVDYFGEFKNSEHELSQNLNDENSNQDFTLCESAPVCSLSDTTVESNCEEMPQKVHLEQDDVENLRPVTNDVTIDIHHQINAGKTLTDSGENLATEDEICNASTDEIHVSLDRTSEEMTSEDPRLAEAVSENSSSPVLLVDVNSIGSISVATTDDPSGINAVSNLEDATFVFENTESNLSPAINNGGNSVDIVAEIKSRSEQRGNVKRKKKPKIWQELQCRRKKAKVPLVQFVRIEPKTFLEVGENSKKPKQGNTKQNRLLASNPTRRGVMLCPLCQKDVGCRSRTCKYCKVAINLHSTKSPLDQKNLLAVELCEETCAEYTIFSVKKTLDASEDRCFISKGKILVEKGTQENERMSEFFSCDCVDNNPVEKTSCEHTVCMYKDPKVIHARNVILTPSKIGTLPIDFIFKLKLTELWENLKDKEFPLVQQVCQNTLVVLDVDSNVGATPSSCVHVRFEKIKRRSIPELHIFCSGMTCSAWNDVREGEDGPLTCMHYCVSLWAIASDDDLQKYLKIFLDATQVYLHSEVFDNVQRE